MLRKSISLIIVVAFIFSLVTPVPKAQAQDLLGLPEPGTMVSLSPAYTPALIKGLTVHKDNPFLFDFIVDTGNSRLSGDALKKEGDRLIKYFFAALTIPDRDLWVNLSPYEKDRMVPQALGQTAMGRDLLAQDYMLKQLTASLIYPEKELGKNFWDKVYARAREQFGTTNIPVNTFNKVWIVAEKASVYEHNQTAFIVSGHLKVMLEEDYLALQKHTNNPVILSAGPHDVHSLASQIVRAIILPAIEHEVNTGKNFATLRQIFYSQILATWFKRNLKQALVSQVYADKSTVSGVNLKDPSIKEQIYQRYLQAYKKGAYNYIKEETDPVTQQSIPRKYFSGGFAVNSKDELTLATQFEAKQAEAAMVSIIDAKVLLTTSSNAAMMAEYNVKQFMSEDVLAGTKGKWYGIKLWLRYDVNDESSMEQLEVLRKGWIVVRDGNGLYIVAESVGTKSDEKGFVPAINFESINKASVGIPVSLIKSITEMELFSYTDIELMNVFGGLKALPLPVIYANRVNANRNLKVLVEDGVEKMAKEWQKAVGILTGEIKRRALQQVEALQADNPNMAMIAGQTAKEFMSNKAKLRKTEGKRFVIELWEKDEDVLRDLRRFWDIHTDADGNNYIIAKSAGTRSEGGFLPSIYFKSEKDGTSQGLPIYLIKSIKPESDAAMRTFPGPLTRLYWNWTAPKDQIRTGYVALRNGKIVFFLTASKIYKHLVGMKKLENTEALRLLGMFYQGGRKEERLYKMAEELLREDEVLFDSNSNRIKPEAELIIQNAITIIDGTVWFRNPVAGRLNSDYTESILLLPDRPKDSDGRLIAGSIIRHPVEGWVEIIGAKNIFRLDRFKEVLGLIIREIGNKGYSPLDRNVDRINVYSEYESRKPEAILVALARVAPPRWKLQREWSNRYKYYVWTIQANYKQEFLKWVAKGLNNNESFKSQVISFPGEDQAMASDTWWGMSQRERIEADLREAEKALGQANQAGDLFHSEVSGRDIARLHRELDGLGKRGTTDRAMLEDPGGIDLNTLNNGLSVTKDANGGVKITVDPAMIERVRREGIRNATPVILNMRVLVSVDQLLGF